MKVGIVIQLPLQIINWDQLKICNSEYKSFWSRNQISWSYWLKWSQFVPLKAEITYAQLGTNDSANT